jgi:hypothetical protein
VRSESFRTQNVQRQRKSLVSGSFTRVFPPPSCRSSIVLKYCRCKADAFLEQHIHIGEGFCEASLPFRMSNFICAVFSSLLVIVS